MACLPVWGQDNAAVPQSADVGLGVVTGTVYDGQTGQGIRNAVLKVSGGEQVAVSDIDGRCVLRVPPGTHKLMVRAEGYFEQPVDGVVIKGRETVYIDPVLVSQSIGSNEKVVVTADTPKTAGAKSVLLERKLADTIIDNVSAEEISKNPDSSAAGAPERPIVFTSSSPVGERKAGDRFGVALAGKAPTGKCWSSRGN